MNIPYKHTDHPTQTNLPGFEEKPNSREFENKKQNTEENKMAYNAQNAKELETILPKDSVLNGVIINIDDGVTKDYVSEEAQKVWKGDLMSPAINITVEVSHGENKVQTKQMFTYVERDGVTAYPPKSNLGKYHKKYNKLPEVQDVIKVITDDGGFAKIKLD